MVPVVSHGGYWQVTVRGQTHRLETRQELEAMLTRIRNSGFYPAMVSPDELRHLSQEEGAVDRRFTTEMISSLDRWLDMADGKLRGGQIPCILNGGNDDIWEIDDIIEQSPCVSFGEGKVAGPGRLPADLDGLDQPDAVGHLPRGARGPSWRPRSRPSPARCRDMKRTIFNFHAPPYGTGLDEAPALDDEMRPMHGGAVMKPVGSTAVREAILKHQPLLSVHGHIHESRGVKRMGRTLAINPGSVYGDGVLQGAVIDLDPKKGKVSRYILVNG